MQHLMGLMAAVVATKFPGHRGGLSLAENTSSSSSRLVQGLLGWGLTSVLHSPCTTEQIMSITTAEQPKLSVIWAIKTSELVGTGCLPPGGTSSRSNTQEGMSQETSWSYTFFLSWVV